jgi:serine/threonine protein kinase
VPHTNLVGYEGSLLTDEAAVLCIENVGGGDLFTLLERRGPFAPEQARIYIGEICLALGHLHSLDIIHRDVTVRTRATTHTCTAAAVPKMSPRPRSRHLCHAE